MRKIAFIKIATLTVAGVLSQGALAADGTVKFTGEITDAICSVSPASQNLVVPLGKVSRTVLHGAPGKGSVPAKFSIDLSNCPAGSKKAKVTFSGQGNNDNKDVLAIANAGVVGPTVAATGVGIEIGDSAGSPIALGSPSSEYILGEGDNSLKFQARYLSTTNAVTVGPADSTAQFTIAYN
jgi:type 1 fimbria pilin